MENFSLGRLGHALEHCVGNYTACPTYLELLIERRARRRQAAERNGADARKVVQISIRGKVVPSRSAGAPETAVAPGL
ncbi:MAG: hypothetical protein NZ561_11170 [Phycisphaerae bacterium]|nr:hypothetical protein [Phycisphaerae bacterium]MDW8262267.1 hypothetical protein [Phycisphaerales bacterium]